MIATERSAPSGFVHVVWTLLCSARRRAVGRQRRQRELLRRRTGKGGWSWSWLGFIASLFLTALLNGLAGFLTYEAVTAGERADLESHGKIVVSRWFREEVIRSDGNVGNNLRQFYQSDVESFYHSEARHIAFETGKSASDVETELRDAVAARGADALIADDSLTVGLRALAHGGVYPGLLGSLVLFAWAVMIIFQGEGLELDLQRRRHPMWEWLFSHPAPPGAVFMAEMLSPIAANPIYCTVPLFPGLLYGLTYGPALGLVAAVAIGIPVSIAAACTGKALEIGAVLRFAPRTRGAMIGLMSWLGYASMMLFFFGVSSFSKMAAPLIVMLKPLSVVPWPWLGLFLGQVHGTFSFPLGVLTCWLVSLVVVSGAVWFSRWAAQQGLSGSFGRADAAPAVRGNGVRFGKDPLYRKELLWFARDRSAIVQTILIPVTVAGFQLFNMRGLINDARSQWNYLCGAAILFGTYFLWVLGPKSLASEGSALWISLTWPRGLENLLKAKAWLWSLLSSGIVLAVLLYSAYMFPAESWKVLLVGIGWFFFGRSMAEKTVTLVRVPSSSGEPEKVSRTRQWGASLGMLTFAIGILTQQWNIAIMGIVYSYITAAAMWENFRARLPFLYDPWSEKLPPPPTLMHAMIAISVLVEVGAVLTGLALTLVARDAIATVQVVIYGICASVVSLFMWRFLRGRDVPARQVWCWNDAMAAVPPGRSSWWCGDGTHGGRFVLALLGGLGGGLLLGIFAHGYIAILMHFPSLAEIIEKGRQQLAQNSELRTSYGVIAICFAPFAEEYLFRGLLFRALDREWGGWRAVMGSGAFFAIYHPVLSWLPVGLLGMTNSLLFKKTGRLAPAVVLHMVYNAVVLS